MNDPFKRPLDDWDEWAKDKPSVSIVGWGPLLLALAIILAACLAVFGCASTHVAPPTPTATEQSPDSSYGKTVYNSGDYGAFTGRDGLQYQAMSVNFHLEHPSCPGVWTTIYWNGAPRQMWAVQNANLYKWYAGTLNSL